ncbi:MAG: 16S rRNA (uracil1498-N3)-methyltransferase [Desulforhopalus sp.]|jgi:16S rRNA (uracil1498-N3)-methyltransferase
MRRFFFDPKTRRGDRVVLSKEESRHIKKVLRLEVGSTVELLDGEGGLFSGEITRMERVVEAVITGTLSEKQVAADSLVVFQGILKGEKMDTVVQKCTELGVTTMVAYQSSRCQGKLDTSIGEKKHGRWQRIGLAACKQCMRPLPMDIAQPLTFKDAVCNDSLDEQTIRILFWEEEQKMHLRDIKGIETADSIALLLGPEGGLSPEEVALAAEHGWISVSLGQRILRAETATLTAVSIVQYLAGRL